MTTSVISALFTMSSVSKRVKRIKSKPAMKRACKKGRGVS